MSLKEYEIGIHPSLGVWANQCHLSNLENLIMEISGDIKVKKIWGNHNHKGAVLEYDDMIYEFTKSFETKTDQDREYAVAEYYHWDLLLNKDGKNLLNASIHMSFGSNSDGSIDWVDGYRVNVQLNENEVLAEKLYDKIINHFEEYVKRKDEELSKEKER